MNIFLGIMIPFLGTTAGAACVFFLKNAICPAIQKTLLGFASGVMVAASVWSLLIPSIEMSHQMGSLAFIPAVVGFLFGILFLLGIDHVIPHQHPDQKKPEGPKSSLSNNLMLILAVTLHNIPEGMAVGVVFAGVLADSHSIPLSAAYALATGIAIQNFPEGAIISLPLKGSGFGRLKSFVLGTLSGIVEPISAFLTVLLSSYVLPILPYLLAFAAGAMIYVVVEELIPESAEGTPSDIGTIGFAVGFMIMMILDVMLG